MAKRTPSENLKSFSIVYIILIVIYIIAVLLCNFVPDVANIFKSSEEGKEALLAINIGVIISCACYLWYFWLARRVADGKSKGTLYMILLILGIVSGIVTAFLQKGLVYLAFDSIVDICGLCYLYQARKGQ